MLALHGAAELADPAVDAELDRLPVMKIAELRIRYRELFRSDPPKTFGPDLLRRSVAHRIQEKAYGPLPRPVQRLLDQMIKEFGARPGGRVALPRQIKAGSVLVRQWKKQSHRVMVLTEGFAYEGKTYTNLSEIAGLITGTRWNGPRFFGLRSKTAGAAPKRGGPGAAIGHVAGDKAPSRYFGGGSDYRKRKAELAVMSAPGGDGHGV
jgi:hypothetical protein